MRSKSTLIVHLSFLLSTLSRTGANFYGANYWNDRYSAQGINYETGSDMFNGLWSATSAVSDNYGRPNSDYSSRSCSCACNENEMTVDCTGTTTVTLKNYNFENLTAETFHPGTTEITIVSNLKTIHPGTFALLNKLTKLTIHNTDITIFPDVSNCTSLLWLDLTRNKINLSPLNYKTITFSPTLERVSLMENEIDWLPPGFFSKTNIQYLGLSRNTLTKFPSDSLQNMLNLTFMSVDENQITSISKRNLLPLASTVIQHLNFSNNLIDYIAPKAFRQLQLLKILELHRNLLTDLPSQTMDQIPQLLHLDLSYNKLAALRAKAITDLPFLRTLVLHNQLDGFELSVIRYNAFIGIGGNLTELYLSSNKLTSFPHGFFSEETYDKLRDLHIDHNEISNITEFTDDQFDGALTLYSYKLTLHDPFANIPYLEKLHLDSNRIEGINHDDLCKMIILNWLQLDSNLLTDDTLDENAFMCLTNLGSLYLGSNNFKYVPPAVQYQDRVLSLSTLDLSSNDLTFLLAGAFSNVTTLRSLTLQSNKIISVENGAFPLDIRTIDLSYNDFYFLHENPFQNLTMLSSLSLQYNEIDVIPDTAFDGCSSLANLYLYDNKIGRILRTTIEDCPLSGNVYFHNNEIAYIEDGSFAHITSTSRIYLQNNRLTKIPNGGDFADMSFYYISFQQNFITSIQNGTFKNIKGSYLYLSDNDISFLEPHAFKDVSCTYDISLNSNPLWTISSYSFHTVSCRYLYMTSLGLSTIPSFAFSGLTASRLYMESNSITTIEEEAFDVSISSQLYLQSNQLYDIRGKMFVDGSSVNELHLENNELPSIPPDAFDGATLSTLFMYGNVLTTYPAKALASQNLQEINLNNNQIGSLPDNAFEGQTSLRELNLENNRLTDLPAGIFEPLTNLQELDLSGNELSFWPTMPSLPNLRTLDLSNNKIESVGIQAFHQLSTTVFSTLNLGNNVLGCSCNMYFSLVYHDDAIKGGECSTPHEADGVTFVYSNSYSEDYFQQWDNQLLFQCAPYNVSATAPDLEQILVTWTEPVQINPNITVNETDFSDWQFSVTCTSETAITLYDITNSSSLLFDADDMVQTGTDYLCHVTLMSGNYTSVADEYVPVTTLESVAETNATASGMDLKLAVKYYDFSFENPDFTPVGKDVISNPTYVVSPYGAWLAISENPSGDSFSRWFRQDPLLNMLIETDLVLEWVNSSGVINPINRYYSASYYPVDGLGFTAQGQRDCNFILHNFGFTSAIRTGMTFNGSEIITIGGGDEIWFYVNKILVLELHGDISGNPIKCKKINLANAGQEGGGFVIPEEGTVVNGECVITGSLTDEQVFLQLETGVSYFFDIFHTERNPCSSEFFLELQGVTFLSIEAENPPVDYSVTINEDLHLNVVIESIWVADVFSSGPNFQVTITKGNEARHFTLKNNTAENIADGAEPPTEPPPDTYYANGTAFIICDTVPQIVPELNVSETETFDVHSDKALITLATELDFEAGSSSYLLIISVIDVNANPQYEGSVTVQITVLDVNDNCPVVANNSLAFFPIPVLQQESLTNVLATDADSGVNQDITYHTSDITQIPIENDTFSILELTIAAIDGGTPTRGTIVNITVTISNTCLYDAIYEPIDIHFDSANNGFFLRVPKYYVIVFDCKDDLGLRSGVIQDSMVSASSHYDEPHTANRARLFANASSDGKIGSGWIAGASDTNQWLQVDMGIVSIFSGVKTQGVGDVEAWIETYYVEYSNDSTTWIRIQDADGNDELFTGNVDQDSVSFAYFDEVYARYIRFLPQSWHSLIGLRAEIVGCSTDKRFRYLTQCVRCETTNYCIGDGIQRPCGRCDPPSDSCSRSASEHSFGHAYECLSCPIGWLCKDGYATPCPTYHHGRCNATYCPETCTLCEPGTACFSGVQSICPRGYFSIGSDSEFCKQCKPGTYNNDTAQSSCLNCPPGYQSTSAKTSCAPCEVTEWSVGDGTLCKSCSSQAECPCMSDSGPCADGVFCVNQGSGNYVCGECPKGFSGDGLNCADINECDTHDPCWGTCINLVPGYECSACPAGYVGDTPHGIGVDHAQANQQVCTDIDECSMNNGGCDPVAECINTDGSYSCGFCPPGYLGNGIIGCTPGDYCILGKNNCHENATCISTGAGTFVCECNSGWAGNGVYCDVDIDLDGRPEFTLLCSALSCKADNCPQLPNSGQEDTDSDGIGDLCDNDDDNDSIFDSQDNCQYVANYAQVDSDGDGVGDSCDNCPSNSNPDQADTDGDGQGDECDSDSDNDGIDDVSDNCPLIPNVAQDDSDSDNVGDVCDNCPDDYNPTQADTDENRYGDICDVIGGTDKDMDGDGILDIFDNCESNPNSDQSDNDMDGIGDLCDNDKDGDGITDDNDNCPYVSNSGQEDTNGNNIGDVCETDYDGDGTIDNDDICPNSNLYQVTDFASDFLSVELYPTLTDATSPIWIVTDTGKEIRDISNTIMPCMLLTHVAMASVDYTGTMYVNTNEGSEYMGFVFGYQSNRKFYVVMWRHSNANNPSDKAGIRGIQIKRVNSNTGPGLTLANALYHSYTTADQVELLWHDPYLQGWQHQIAYKWFLTHRPDIGLIRVVIKEGEDTLVDSGDLYDTTYLGGRLGVFVYNQQDVIWSRLSYKCADRVNQALELDGVDDYVILPTIETLQLTLSFTLEAWVYLPSGYPSTIMPVLCTLDTTLCMYIENGNLIAKVGSQVAVSSSTVTNSTWKHLAVRFDAQNAELSVFIDGVLETTEISVATHSWVNGTQLFLGRDENNFFTGILDEVRIWGLTLTDTEVQEHMQLASLARQKHKDLLDARYSMDDEEQGASMLLDQGSYSHHGLIMGGAFFTPSSLDQARFQVTYPDNRRRRRRRRSIDDLHFEESHGEL